MFYNLDIHISKDMALRQQLNFLPKNKKKQVNSKCGFKETFPFILLLLLTRAVGVSRFVFPALSLFVNDISNESFIYHICVEK